MSEKQHVGLLIIGSGEAGKNLAWAMANAGQRVAVVERKLIGGSCPNIACLPSKNVIHSAKVAQFVHRAAEFGIKTSDISIDMPGVRARKRKMVDGEIQVHLELYKASGAELIMGEAHFVAPKTVEVRSNDGTVRILSGDQVVLNLGTHAAIPDIPGLKAAKPMTHVEALELDRLPEHLVVLGGGFVGLELAQAMRRFGSRVTILERGQQLAGREDPDVAEAILHLFQDEGIEVLFDTEVLDVEGLSGQGVKLRVRNSHGERSLDDGTEPHRDSPLRPSIFSRLGVRLGSRTDAAGRLISRTPVRTRPKRLPNNARYSRWPLLGLVSISGRSSSGNPQQDCPRLHLHCLGELRERVLFVLGSLRPPGVVAHATLPRRDRTISSPSVSSHASPHSSRMACCLRGYEPSVNIGINAKLWSGADTL